MESLNEYIESITVAEETHIYNRKDKIYTHIDCNFEVFVYQLEDKDDLAELLNQFITDCCFAGIVMPDELETWLNNLIDNF